MDILLVIDMQRDFINGALGTPEAARIVPLVAARIARAREAGETVFFTMDTHGENYAHTQEGVMLPVPHCVKGTEGFEIAPEIRREMRPDMPVFEKYGFGSPDMARALVSLAEAANCPLGAGMRIELCGLCADICVVSAALLVKAFLPEARLTLDPALTAGVTPESCEAALTVMRACQIVIPQGK